jgi:hypothetical protein
VYSNAYRWIYLKLQMYILNAYEWPYSTYIQKLLLTLNGFDIMDTLGVCFECIKILCRMFIKCIANHLTN